MSTVDLVWARHISTTGGLIMFPSSSFPGIAGQLLLGVGIGITAHLAYFIHGERHMEAPRIMWVHILAFCVLTYTQATAHGTATGSRTAAMLSTSYLAGLFCSIIMYRVFFHRLRKFPGPRLAGISKLWHMCQTSTCKNYLFLDEMHKQYGDFIRTGPTEITIVKPEAPWATDGPGTRCTKAVWYDILLPFVALNTTRGKEDHDRRRRAWDQAVTVKAMEAYEERISLHLTKMKRFITSKAGQPINVTEAFYFLAFDVMGDFAFGKSFNMLSSHEWHHVVLVLRRALSLLGPFSPVPWLARIAFSLPIIPIIRDWHRMLHWCADHIKAQIAEDIPQPSVGSHLINYSKQRNSVGTDMRWLQGDSVALIVAGSDTVASMLVYFFYRMAQYPAHANQIRQEIEALQSISDTRGLKECVHLNACINEVLRLHSPITTGGYRETPPEGVVIADTYIPGNVTVVAPQYVLNRLETSYVQPYDFIPERWSSRPELLLNKKAFTPFGLGRYSCVGKGLALTEIRMAAAMLLSEYDVTFAPGEDGVAVVRDMKDQFTAVPGELNLVFRAGEKN